MTSLLPLFGLALTLIRVGWPWLKRRQLAVAWESAARELGLDYVPRQQKISGRVGEFFVEISWDRSEGNNTEVVLHGEGRLFSGSIEGKNSLSGFFRKKLPPAGSLSGDAHFDEQVSLSGPPDQASASLNEAAREEVLSFVARGGKLLDGKLMLGTPTIQTEAAAIVELVQTVRRVAKALQTKDVPGALADQVAREKLASVRLRDLQLLDRHYPNFFERKWAAMKALGDFDSSVVKQAAQMLGPDARAVLLKMLEDENALIEIRCTAVEQLVLEAGRDCAPYLCIALRADDRRLRRAGVLAFSSLFERRPEVWREVKHDADFLEALFIPDARAPASTPHVSDDSAEPREHDKPGAKPPDALAGNIARSRGWFDEERERELAESLAVAFGQVDDPRSEPRLLQLLQHQRDDVCVKAAFSLGRIGSVNAVEALLAKSHGSFPHHRLNEAAKAAVRAIQERLDAHGAHEAGQISLVENPLHEGAVQVAPEAGAVELAREPALHAKSREPA